MSLTLYDLPHSPYCLPIKRILQALKQPFAIEDLPNWDRHKIVEMIGSASSVDALVSDPPFGLKVKTQVHAW